MRFELSDNDAELVLLALLIAGDETGQGKYHDLNRRLTGQPSDTDPRMVPLADVRAFGYKLLAADKAEADHRSGEDHRETELAQIDLAGAGETWGF